MRCVVMCASLLRVSSVLAQAPTGGVSGRVVSGATPVVGAVVVARTPGDSAAAARAVSGADGRFQLRGLAAGSYAISASHLGRIAPAAQATVPASGSADVGDLRLGGVVLEGVQVRAERPPVVHAEDRNVYSVKDMPVAAGAAADVMRTIPELEVDLDGSVRMVGNRPVTIHINGRPSPLRGEALTEFVRNLPADRIERIEVIPNPSVRFEGGETAIVNIVLKRNVELGMGGSLSLNAATNGGNGLSGQVARQRGRLSIFGGGSTRLWGFSDENREVRQNLLATPITFLDQDRRSEGRSTNGSGDLTAELAVGAKGTLWASGSGSFGGFDSDVTSFNQLLDADSTPVRTYDRLSRSESDSHSAELAVGFRRIVEAQRDEMSVEVRMSGWGSDNTGRFEDQPVWQAQGASPVFELRTTRSASDVGLLVAKADYMRPLGGGRRLELGVRASREEQSNEQLLRVFDQPGGDSAAQTVDNPYRYLETQRSAYANLSQRVGRLSVQGGLRAEATAMQLQPTGDGAQPAFDKDYFALFPSANLSLGVREGVDLRLSYAGRVRRPYYWDLNPYVQQTDSRNVRRGNPDLRPAQTRSFSMDLSWRARLVTLRLAPYYRRTDDEVEYIRTVDSAGVSTGMPRNLATLTSYGATLNGSLRAAAWGNLSTSLGVTRDERDAGALGAAYSRSGTSRFVSANANLQPGRGFSAQASVRLSTPRETAQGRQSSTAFSQVGVRKELAGGRSSLDLRVTDPFNVFRTRFESRDPSFAGSSSNRSSWGTRSLSFSFTHRFGRPPERKSTRTEEGGPPAGGVPTP